MARDFIIIAITIGFQMVKVLSMENSIFNLNYIGTNVIVVSLCTPRKSEGNAILLVHSTNNKE